MEAIKNLSVVAAGLLSGMILMTILIACAQDFYSFIRPRCVRCAIRLWRRNTVRFHGVCMCESCENIAQYYSNIQ